MRRLKVIGNSRITTLHKNYIFWIFVITALAIIVRSLPAWINAAWGCDFGIYFGITKSVAESGTLFPAYTGWGGSYNEFPVLYAVNAFAHWLTGIDIIVLMPKLTPIFGGLSVLVFFFVARKLTRNIKIAILSMVFFAFLPFHVYQTSHASPLTMGHFFIMVSLFLFLKFRENTKYLLPLMISTILLIMSHHLSTYFFLISILGIIFIENASLKNWTPYLRKDIFYMIFASLLVFTYWGFVARTVYEKFMFSYYIGSFRIPPLLIIIGFYVVLGFLIYIIKYVRKINDFVENKNSENVKLEKPSLFYKIVYYLYPFIKKRWSSSRSRIKLFSLVVISVVLLMILFSIIDLPWLGFTFTYESIIYSFPLIVAIGLGVAGFRYTWYVKGGLFIRGWFMALLVSLFLMMIMNNRAILPHRHPEYIMAPLAILMAYGLGGIFSDPFFKGLLSKMKNKKVIDVSYEKRKITISQKRRIFSFLVILLLVFSLAGTTYEVHKALDQSWEEITSEDLQLIDWINLNLDKNTSMITSDHRLERMIESNGFNTTEDMVINLWTTENFTDYADELLGIGKTYNKITHVIIDDIMLDNGVHIGPKDGKFRTIHMANETWNASYEKFKHQPFERICRNESLTIDSDTLEPVHWAEVYEVNWTYIEEII